MKVLKPPPERGQLRIWLAVFAVLWLGGSCIPVVIMGLPFALGLISGDTSLELMLPMAVGLLFTVPFFAVGIGLLGWSVWPLIVGVKVSRPEVYVSSEAVRPGDTFTFNFRQTFKSAVEVKRASVQLVLRETAIYSRGTDTYTVTHEFAIQQFDLPPRSFQAGDVLSDQRLLQIPADAMHTFASTHNKLRWLVKVQVGISGWPDFKEEYEVRVLPERM